MATPDPYGLTNVVFTVKVVAGDTGLAIYTFTKVVVDSFKFQARISCFANECCLKTVLCKLVKMASLCKTKELISPLQESQEESIKMGFKLSTLTIMSKTLRFMVSLRSLLSY